MRHSVRIDRRFLYWLARRLYARRSASPVELPNLQRLLVVRIDERVGNLITLQSFFDALRASLPGVQLGLLCSERKAEAARSLVGIDRLHFIDKRWFLRRPSAWRRAIGEVRKAGYQVAIDAEAWHTFSFTHRALTYFSGAPVRIGYANPAEDGFLTHLVKPGPEGEHELRQRIRLLEPLGLKLEPPQLRTVLGQMSDPRGDWLHSQHAPPPVVGIWAGSRKLNRRWPVSFYVMLCKKLRLELGATLVVLWGPQETAIRDEIASELEGGVLVAPPTDLEALASILRRLDLVVTNDTGPMHLSVAVETPTVALFASGEPQRWGHPYPFVKNLFVPGRQNEEVDQAFDACRELLQIS